MRYYPTPQLKRRIAEDKMREAMTVHTAAENVKFALGMNANCDELLVKFFNFPEGKLQPGSAFSFNFEIEEDGGVVADMWCYNAHTSTDETGAPSYSSLKGDDDAGS